MIIDPIIVALPVSIAVLVIVSMMTKPPGEKHLKNCFE
jgi:hypothetical protein